MGFVHHINWAFGQDAVAHLAQLERGEEQVVIGDQHFGLARFVPHEIDIAIVIEMGAVAVDAVICKADDAGAQVAFQ